MITKKTDVLIIGGGGAGLRAALAAREKNVDVTLVFKKGGNATIFAAGGHSAVIDSTDNQDSFASHYGDTMEGGNWLSDCGLVKIMVEKGPRELQELLNWGVKFYMDKDDKLKGFHVGGHSFPRTARCTGGNAHQLYRVMQKKAKEKGVHIVKGFEVMELLAARGKVQGAVGIDGEGNLMIIKAKSVVLASGGLGQMYQNTTNPKGLSGEGYILGLNAGASLIDMEFIQYIPTSLVYPPQMKGEVVTDSLRGEGALLYNSKMERFMTRYDPEKMERATRDVVARAIYQEIIEGRGTANNGVYVDARSMEREKMLESFTNARRLIAAGVDPGESLFEAAPSAHFCCGGIKIDENCFTGVSGLYAAGEVAGGIHGANRLGGNALTEILVFGRIAGENAARWAVGCCDSSEGIEIEPEFLKRLQELEKSNDRGDDILTRLSALEGQIRAGVWQGAGIIRTAESLKEGLAALEEISRELDFLGINEPLGKAYPLWSRLSKMALVGRIIMGSALRREESRGTHFRSDFPAIKQEYAYSIKVTMDEGKILSFI